MQTSMLKKNSFSTPPPQGDSAPLSVLILSPDPKVTGGVTTFIKMMTGQLKNCRITHFAVGSVKEQAQNPEFRESPVTLLARIMAAPFKVAALASRQHFDVIHINPSFNVKGLVRDGLTLLALRLSGHHNILVYFHGWQTDLERRVARNPLTRRLLAWLLGGTEHVMVLSPEFKQALEQMGVRPEKITFARTMFDGEGIRAAERFPAEGQRRSVVFMSRFVREKGIYELVDAFARVAADFPDADLIMAGHGEENDALRAAAARHDLGSRIQFPGYVGGDEKFRLLRQCTVYALPTYFPEGMPVALLEAMGAGKPVLTAKAGSIRHIIADPDNGVVLDSVSVDTVEKGLRRLLGDRQYCADTGRANASYAWKTFEAAGVTAEIETLYRIIARR